MQAFRPFANANRRVPGRFGPGTRGQSLVMAAFTLFGLAIASLMILGVARASARKLQVQNAADAAALAIAQVQADCLAQIAWINEAMASVYYDAMRDCASVAVWAVQAELADGRGLSDLTPGGWNYLIDTTPGCGPEAPSTVVAPDARDRWEHAYRVARERVPAAERWLHRLSQLECSIGLLAPELMRHQAFYTARRNLAGDEKNPDVLANRCRVALYPDLNVPDNVLFVSDGTADKANLHIVKAGEPGTARNGWRGWSDTTPLEFEFIRHRPGLDDVDADVLAAKGRIFGTAGFAWDDQWSGFFQRGESAYRYDYKYCGGLRRYRDGHNGQSPATVNAPNSDNYLFHAQTPNGDECKLLRYRAADAAPGGRQERIDILDVGNDQGVTTLITRMDDGSRLLEFWDLAGDEFGNINFLPAGNRHQGREPDQRVRENPDGGASLYDKDKDRWVEMPESVTLPNGIKVPVEYSRTFRLGGSLLHWGRPFVIILGDMHAEILDGGDVRLAVYTRVGCCGTLRFAPDDRSASIHDLSTLSPGKAWRRVQHYGETAEDRLRHRLYLVEDAPADGDEDALDGREWLYEWVDPGPYLSSMSGLRFGYHAVMDREHPGVDYDFPVEDDDKDAASHADGAWDEKLSAQAPNPVSLWLRRPVPNLSPAEVMTLLHSPADPDDPDETPDDSTLSPPLSLEAYGGWFDLAAGRPYHEGYALHQTVECWYCKDKGYNPGQPLARLDEPSVLYVRPCGFWVETFDTEDDYNRRLRELKEHFIYPESGEVLGKYALEIPCPLACARDWSQSGKANAGTLPLNLLRIFNKEATEVPTHVRVSLHDAATRSFLHPDNQDNRVGLAGSSLSYVPPNSARPTRRDRSIDYGYRMADPSTHWTRDFFGLFRDNPRNQRVAMPYAGAGEITEAQYRNDPYQHAVIVESGIDAFCDAFGLWLDERGESGLQPWAAAINQAYRDSHIGKGVVRRPLEVASVGEGQLFRQGWAVMVWAEADSWIDRLLPSGAPKREEVSEAYRQTVRHNADNRAWTGSVDDNLPPGGALRPERHWARGVFQPLRNPDWGFFGIAASRPFFPDPDDPSRHRHAFPWDNVDVGERDRLDRVVNPARRRWLNSPANLFEADWRAALTPLASTLDLRDVENEERGDESDIQWLFRNLPDRAFRHGVTDNNDGRFGEQPRRQFNEALQAPPMQGANAGQPIRWTSGSDGDLEQVIAK